MKFSFRRSSSCPNCNGKNTLREFHYDKSSTEKEYYCNNASCDYITSYTREYEQAKQYYLQFGKTNHKSFKFQRLDKDREKLLEEQSKVNQPTLPSQIEDSSQLINDNLCPNCEKELIPFNEYGNDNTNQYFCPDEDCRYATVYGNTYETAFREYLEKQYRNHTNDNNDNDVNVKNYTINLDKIIGYEGIKRKLRKIINHKGEKKIHVLIVGAAGTSKTVFLQSLKDELEPQGCKFHYIDASTMTKRGLLDDMFDKDIEILAIDELDKVDKEHQTVFLNMLETGILQTTSYNNIRKKEVKSLICLATGNDLKKIIEPLRTRFLTFYLKAYTKEQYIDICTNMLIQKYEYINKELAEYIAIETYKKIKPINMRDADRIGNLIRDNPTKEEVNFELDDLVTHAIPNCVLDKLDKQS